MAFRAATTNCGIRAARTSALWVSDGRRKITASTTCPEAAPHLLSYVPEASVRTLDNHRPRARSTPRSRPRRRAAQRPEEASEGLPACLVLSCTQGSGLGAYRDGWAVAMVGWASIGWSGHSLGHPPAVTWLVRDSLTDEPLTRAARTGHACPLASANRLVFRRQQFRRSPRDDWSSLPEYSGWKQPRARDAGQRGLGQPARRDGPDRGGFLPEAAWAV
jgi:hypothetical protein